jgi:hypothetical protein
MKFTSPQEKGIHFAKLISALAQSALSDVQGRTPEDAVSIAEKQFRDTPTIALAAWELREKAAVGAGTPTTAGWADDLVVGQLIDDFMEGVRAQAVIERLQGVRRVPFEARVPKESSAGFGGGWRGGPGGPLPAIKTALDTLSLPMLGCGGIMVTDEELVRLMRPAHARTLRDLLTAGLIRYQDTQFLDPSISAVANVSPASILNGATEITSTGSSLAAMVGDAKNIIDAVTTNLDKPVWIMQRKDAVHIAVKQESAGLTPTVTALGGMWLGIPVITSASIPGTEGSPATDRIIALLDAASVLLADEGTAEISVSRVTSIQMDDAPTSNAATGTATTQVSMFQTHSVATKIMRPMNWTRAHDGCAAYMQVSW